MKNKLKFGFDISSFFYQKMIKDIKYNNIIFKTYYSLFLINQKFRITIFKYNISIFINKITNKSKIFMKFTIFLSKYLFIALTVLFFIPWIGASIKSESNYFDLDFIVTLIPMIITIVTIALNFQQDEILGISGFKFRELRKGFTFNFLEMILIAIIILGLNALSKIKKNETALLYLNLISFIYSIWFSVQEIPLICQNQKYIMWICKRILNEKRDTENGLDSKDSDFNEIIDYLIFNRGILKTFKDLRCEKLDSNIETFLLLLSRTNKYLEELRSNLKFINIHGDVEYYTNSKNKVDFIITELISMFSDIKDDELLIFCKNES